MKIAVLTHTFPPTSHGNAKRPYYVVQSLLDAGWEVDVYTSPFGCKGDINDELKHPSLRVHIIGDMNQKLLKMAAKVPVVSRLAITAIQGLSWPDANAKWVKKVSKILQKDHTYDRVLAFVFPSSMFLTGGYSDLVDEKWVYDLQESVTPQARIVQRRSPLFKWRLPKLEALEKLSMQKAGKVIFTAETNRQAYLDAGIVDAGKTVHIPYFYDEAFFNKLEKDSPEAGFNINYFGSFDWRGSRTPNAFLRSLQKFLESTPEARDETKFMFFGSWLSEHDKVVDELGLRQNVQINKAVSYDEYMRKLPKASVLLLVVSSEHNLFMPSKIVDYFGAQRPILAYVPEGSEMAQVLLDAGMQDFTVSETDFGKGAEAIKALWELRKSSNLKIQGDKTAQWSSSQVTKKYIEILVR